jgi:hypothetical protein
MVYSVQGDPLNELEKSSNTMAIAIHYRALKCLLEPCAFTFVIIKIDGIYLNSVMILNYSSIPLLYGFTINITD